ncbi:type VI secretion system baseplate subunit TssF [Parashewanella spongiae]|uniref:Type VI secretion system baseplate subunit TssF n=1 Tax=Parashewanella spongiae TaxID=342950 RepID=A0A3A6U141_9GAMM|nr:type VI secretion system baseplate subunit TssF [Parashewanella spongiae]MCL1078174.1 type VI secretion system baseplate subunit TssF [Parashewanella spongiae]RJY14891.1 type VI secretion system baseplate subunit TssF [Parashewanella spongiae]
MSDSLLSYFEQELRFIQKEGALFAAKHPNAASGLGLSKDGIDDPQIARLIESVALLNGKLQHRLDGSFPEFTESLVRILFPHYLRAIPSYSMLDFVIDDSASANHVIPAQTEFDVKGKDDTKAILRTTEDVTLYPIKMASANVYFAPFIFAKPKKAEQAKALLEIKFETVDEGMSIAELDIDSLKLHLKGETNSALKLYDVLSQSVSEIAVFDDEQAILLGRQVMSPVGFDEKDTVLPSQAASFGGFVLLTEFFMFAERFNGFKFDLKNALSEVKGNTFKLQLFLDELSVDLARSLSIDNFSLFCTPVVDLHRTTTDPVVIDFFKKQYPIVLDSTQIEGIELFSVDTVLDVTDEKVVTVPKIYGEKYHSSETGLRWQLNQEMHENGQLESSLQVADLEHVSARGQTRTWSIQATATHGNKASQLPISSQIKCRDSLTIPAKMQLLKRPSLPFRNEDISQSVWALLCHLHFNYHSILGSKHPRRTLKNVLYLYNHNKSSQNSAYIESVVNIEQEQVVAPIRVSGKSCFAYGTKITVTLDTSDVNGGVALFSRMLDRFFSYFAGFNSFTQVDIRIEGQDRAYLQFPRRAGCKSLL